MSEANVSTESAAPVVQSPPLSAVPVQETQTRPTDRGMLHRLRRRN